MQALSEAELGALSEEEQRELHALLEAQHGGEGLADFIRRMTVTPAKPEGLEPPAHILEKLLPVLELAAIQPMRVIITMPPRHAKTTTVMHAIAWHMMRNPHLVHAYVSYNETQTEKFSRKIRDIAERAGVVLESTRLDYWSTKQGGGMHASSSITGNGVTGWLVIDDPIKGREEAESSVERQKKWEWFTDDANTRLQRGASCIVIQTRWHEEDLAGRLLKDDTGNDWLLIEMSAIRDPETDEPTDAENGIALWPAEFPLERLISIRSTMGVYGWWSLYQQRPRARGNQLFIEPARYTRATFKLDGYRIIWTVDPAATAKTSSDYSVAVLLGIKGHGDEAVAVILDVVRVQEQIPPFVRRVAALARARRCGVVAEAVGGFKAVPQMLRDIAPGLRVIEVFPSTDKFVRAQPLSAAWNQGRVLVPVDTDAPWVEAFIDEFRAFTGLGDSHDDQVDAASHGWNALYMPMPARRGQREAPFLPFG